MEHRSQPLFAPATILLLVTGFFHLGRGAIPAGLAFLIVACALAIDARMSRARAPLSNQPAWRWWRDGHEAIGWPMIAAAAVVLGAVLGSLPRFSMPAEILVVVIGAPVFFCAWMDSARPTRKDAQPKRLRFTATVWIVVGVATCLWELTAFIIDQVSHNYHQFPTLSNLLWPLLDNTAIRILVVIGWVFVGIGMIKFRRSR